MQADGGGKPNKGSGNGSMVLALTEKRQEGEREGVETSRDSASRVNLTTD